jgi:2-polyprenyl-3-methyl-5-hydroxy-6-metoxy-1,4-benzoquinol methylase
MRDYYEDLWARLPGELHPPDVELRSRLLSTELRPGERVLDIGCGEGTFTAVIAAAGAHPIGVEVAESAIDRARAAHPGLDFRLAPIGGPLPLEDATFDLVWASEVIEHVADTAAWLNELRRVLKRGGRILTTTPNHTRLLIALRGLERYSEPLGDHLHLYTRRSLRDTLSGQGFENIGIAARAGPPVLRRMLVARAVKP